jgi:hypothetical protein
MALVPSMYIVPVVVPGGDLSFFNFDTKDYDLNNWYNTTTSRYTPQIKGIYHLHAQVTLTTTLATPGTSWAAINVYKNGSDYRAGTTDSAGW